MAYSTTPSLSPNNTGFDYKSNKDGSKKSSKSSFLHRTVRVMGCITAFIVGTVFFPIVSIGNAVSEYRYSKNKCQQSIATSAIRAVKGFFLPIPIIGGIVQLTGKLAQRVNPKSYLADNRMDMFSSALISIPFLGAGCISACLCNGEVISTMKSD